MTLEKRKISTSQNWTIGSKIEALYLKESLEVIFAFIRKSNKYFDEERPWVTIKDNREACDRTIATCMYIIQNLSQLLSPFLPFSTKEIQDMLNIEEESWGPITI